MTDRRGLYKNADRDFTSSRRNRQDHSIEIRKVKKEDNLQKRRNIQIDDLSDSSPVKDDNNQKPRMSPTVICKMMKSKILEERIEAVTTCRKELSKQRQPPIQIYFESGAIPILVSILRKEKDVTLLYEAAWALTNIASGESHHTAAVVNEGSSKILIRLLEHKADEITEQCVWALANIAGDSGEHRDQLVADGIVPVVIRSIQRFQNNNSAIKNLAWLMSNICRHKSHCYPDDAILKMIPSIHALLTKNKDVLADLTWALSYATERSSKIINALIANNFLPYINANLLLSDDIAAPSIRVMGNIVTGTDEQANAVIAAGVIESMETLLRSPNPRIVKECCWLLSNISAGTEEQVMALISSQVVPAVIHVLQNGDYKSQKEATWCISNMISCKKDEPKLFLLNHNIFAPLMPMLSCDDSAMIILVLEAIKSLFEVAESYSQLDACLAIFEGVGGVDIVESLQNHSSEDVYQHSYDIIQSYFEEGEGEDEEDQSNCAQFAF